MDYVDLGQRIRKRRLELHWTQEALAECIGVSASFIGHVERGTRKASLETILSISNAMNISMDYLLAGSLNNNGLGATPNGLNQGQRLVMQEILTTLQQHLDDWNKDLE